MPVAEFFNTIRPKPAIKSARRRSRKRPFDLVEDGRPFSAQPSPFRAPKGDPESGRSFGARMRGRSAPELGHSSAFRFLSKASATDRPPGFLLLMIAHTRGLV